MNAPFRRLSRRVLVENRWHRYCLDCYTQADGSEGQYYYIDMHGACAIVPLFDDGSTVLVEVQRYLLGRALWEFPIGGMDAGESALQAAQKELRQEAGLLADDWQKLGACSPYKGVSNEVTHYFVARTLRWTEQELEPSEGITVHRMPLAEARRRILEQELPDGQSMAALMFLDRFRQSGSLVGTPVPRPDQG